MIDIKKFAEYKLREESSSIPIEAVKIIKDGDVDNGYFIEDLIAGYRTIYTKGRESLGREFETYETSLRDGAKVKSSRFPARTITVGFYIKAGNSYDFRLLFNELNTALNVADAWFIFEDEPDVYFKGTPTFNFEFEHSQNTVVGEWQIFCEDPFKYSLHKDEVLAENGVFEFDYLGGYKAYPTLRAEFSSDCGYVGFVGNNGAILQAGSTTETDLEELYEPSQTLVNLTSKNMSLQGWATNSNRGSYDIEVNGTPRVSKVGSDQALNVSSYGTGTGWHGTSVEKDLPADSSGETVSKNFTVSWKQAFNIASKKTAQLGRFMIGFVDSNGNTVFGVLLNKNAKGNKYKTYLIVNDELTYGGEKTLKSAAFYGSARKSGSTISFSVDGTLWSFTVPSIEDAVVKKAVITFATYGTSTPLSSNAVYEFKFIKDNCETYADVPNKFSANDTLEIDCASGNIQLNEMDRNDLGALGNDWESFCIDAGHNKIEIAYSDWANSPEFSLSYRRRFL